MAPYAVRVPKVTEDRRSDRSAYNERGAASRRANKRAGHKDARRAARADLADLADEPERGPGPPPRIFQRASRIPLTPEPERSIFQSRAATNNPLTTGVKMSLVCTSFAGRPAHDSDHATPNKNYCLEGTDASGREWRRVFRSTAALFAAAKAERAALARLDGEERAACSLVAYRVFGRGLDSRTEPVRI